MKNFIKKQPPARIIALGFVLVILLGSLLLSLPCCVKEGRSVTYMDALYTSTSAVCVTGLVVVDTADTFSPLGQFIIAVLIQIGGLGVTAVGAGIILALGRHMNLKGGMLIREAMNLSPGKSVVRFLKNVFLTTVSFQLVGAVLSFFVFVQDFPIKKAISVSLFHAIAAFNNAGFDVLGNMQSLVPYQSNVLLNLVTCALIIFGGIGFLVIREVWEKRFKWKKLSLHARVVLSTSAALIAGGTVLFRLSENMPWMGAFFNSVSARTAGYSTYALSGFTKPGLIVMMALMLIGASPGSTGGGIKTSTVFVLLQGIKSAATNQEEKAFKYTIPEESFKKAAVIMLLALGVVITGTYLLLLMEPQVALADGLFEIVSAFGTVGLSTGITPLLGTGARLLCIVIMFIGRLGPMTIATLWYFNKGERVRYPQGDIAIG
ncbi:MAG: H(+)-transporting ATPase [Clostridia bacterium]|nr:H(+)-transporting ATPase [Clostridia bacterium]